MNIFILVISFVLTFTVAFLSSRSLNVRARAVIFAVYFFLYVLFFPVFLWLPVYFTVDFSKKVAYPEGFKDGIYFNRVNESRLLPINKDGLIADMDYKPGASGKCRIVIIGDSFAAGYGLKFKDTLGAYLQNDLGSGYQVINGAFFGTNTEMQVDYFCNHLLKYKPEIVIIRHRMDDVMPLAEKYYLERTGDVIRKYAPHWPPAIRNRFFRFEMLLIRERFWSYYRANTRKVIKENMLDFFDRLNNCTSAEGIRVLLISDKCRRGYEAVCEAAGVEAASFGWEILNPHETIDFSAPEMIIAGDGHPSARANRVLAGLIRDKLHSDHAKPGTGRW